MGTTEIKSESRPGDDSPSETADISNGDGTAYVSKEFVGAHVQQQQQQQDSDEAQVHPLLNRFINLPSSINFEIIIQSAWETTALTFQFSLLNGGPASMVYGAVLSTFGATTVAMSLAEMASIDPIVGAQYRWSANFAPFAPRFFGLIQGWITVFAWIFNAAGSMSNLGNIVTALAIFNNPSYQHKSWHATLIMWGFLISPIIFNIYFRKLLNFFETIGGIIHVVFFIVSIITLTTLAERSTTDFVFKTVVNSAPVWTNPGIAFMVGLLTVVFPVSGADGVLHMSAEVKRVRTRAPYSILLSTFSNCIMQLAFVICLLFTIGDLDKVTSTPTGLPIVEVYYLATGSKAATNVFITAIFLVALVSLFNNFASVSRLTWAFARDHGLPFSSFFSKVNVRFRMPLNALLLITAVCYILSLIYIGSSTAFNAIISLISIATHVSYILPILFIIMRKINGPPLKFGPYNLGHWGLPINLFSLVYLLFVIIWMPFPTILPVTGSNMNYSGPILVIVILGAIADWVISGHKRFQFPIARYLPED